MPSNVYAKYNNTKSATMLTLCWVFTIVIIGLLALVTGYLVSIGYKSINWAFFTQVSIPVGAEGYPGGMLNALVGTLILILLASLVGIPVGMLTGIYLSEYSSSSALAAPVRFIADVLAGVPSIVVGILGYELLVVPIGSNNGWAGALALAFIMVPIVARTTEEMLKLVPNSYREAAVALGATKARTILGIVVPSAKGSLITGVMLAIARVAGETAPLLFTAGTSRFMAVFHGPKPYIHTSDLNYPFPSLTVQIYSYATTAFKEQNQEAWAGILVLIFLIFVLNLVIRYVARPRKLA